MADGQTDESPETPRSTPTGDARNGIQPRGAAAAVRRWWRATFGVAIVCSALVYGYIFLPFLHPYAVFTFLGTPFLAGFLGACFSRQPGDRADVFRGYGAAMAGLMLS